MGSWIRARSEIASLPDLSQLRPAAPHPEGSCERPCAGAAGQAGDRAPRVVGIRDRRVRAGHEEASPAPRPRVGCLGRSAGSASSPFNSALARCGPRFDRTGVVGHELPLQPGGLVSRRDDDVGPVGAGLGACTTTMGDQHRESVRSSATSVWSPRQPLRRHWHRWRHRSTHDQSCSSRRPRERGSSERSAPDRKHRNLQAGSISP